MRILNVFKILIPAVLSCGFLTACDNNNISTELAFLGLNAAQLTPPANYAQDAQVDQVDHDSSSSTVWTSMSQQFKLDHYAQLSQVQSEIRKLQQDPKDFYKTLEAAEPYIYYILQQTQQHGLPAELALLPVIESAYNPYDREKTGATGLWQLMPQTAADLGIKVNHIYDGRMNVIDSTKAALNYLHTLGSHFKGDWSLALAAYNWGPGNIDSAEKKAGSKNFWQLHMPEETTRYVPKLLAVAEVVQHPEKYGMQLPKVTNKPYFTELKVNKPTNLAQIAKSAGINITSLVHLNSAYQQPSGPIANNTVLVPVEKAQGVETTLLASETTKPTKTILAMNSSATTVHTDSLAEPSGDSSAEKPTDVLQEIAQQIHASVQSLIG